MKMFYLYKSSIREYYNIKRICVYKSQLKSEKR